MKSFLNAKNDTGKKHRLVVGYIKICALTAISLHCIYSQAILVITGFPYQYLFYQFFPISMLCKLIFKAHGDLIFSSSSFPELLHCQEMSLFGYNKKLQIDRKQP